jgi:hypothetical protein
MREPFEVVTHELLTQKSESKTEHWSSYQVQEADVAHDHPGDEVEGGRPADALHGEPHGVTVRGRREALEHDEDAHPDRVEVVAFPVEGRVPSKKLQSLMEHRCQSSYLIYVSCF